MGGKNTGVSEELLHSLPKDATKVMRCLAGNTTVQMDMSSAGQYFYPFEMEFCLTAVGLLLGLLKGMGAIVELYIRHLPFCIYWR